MSDVRIDDLREPRRNAAEQAMYELALQMTVDLDVDGLLAEARSDTGLSNFGESRSKPGSPPRWRPWRRIRVCRDWVAT